MRVLVRMHAGAVHVPQCAEAPTNEPKREGVLERQFLQINWGSGKWEGEIIVISSLVLPA
jgi:hypothetical protein